MAFHSGRIARPGVCVPDISPVAEPARRREISLRRRESMDRSPNGAGRSTEAGGADYFSRTDSASSQSLAPGLYRLWPRLCRLHLQLLAAADLEVGSRRPVQYRGWNAGDDPQLPWPDRDDRGVSSL